MEKKVSFINGVRVEVAPPVSDMEVGLDVQIAKLQHDTVRANECRKVVQEGNKYMMAKMANVRAEQRLWWTKRRNEQLKRMLAERGLG